MERIRWLYGGTAVLVVLSSSVVWSRVMTPFTPMPLHQVVLAWTTGVGFLVAVPAAYFATMVWLWEKAKLGLVVLVVAFAFSLLSVFYFVAAWEYGVSYQGVVHTLIVAVENAVGFMLALSLAFIGYQTGAMRPQVAA